jgi:hypothetical protein
MTIRVLWKPGPSGTTTYHLTSGTTTSSMSSLADVPNSFSVGTYDPLADLYYYDHPEGVSTTFYQVFANNSVQTLTSSSIFRVGFTTYPVNIPDVPPAEAAYKPPPPAPLVRGVFKLGPPPPGGSAVGS